MIYQFNPYYILNQVELSVAYQAHLICVKFVCESQLQIHTSMLQNQKSRYTHLEILNGIKAQIFKICAKILVAPTTHAGLQIAIGRFLHQTSGHNYTRKK